MPLLAAGTGTLYGIGDLAGHTEIFSIDPTTGAMTPVAAASNPNMVGGISAFDPIAKRIFFESTTDLYIVNLITGTESHVPLSAGAGMLQFDYLSNTLYTIGDLGGHTEIFSIDTSTGAMTPLVAASNSSMIGGISAFDPVTKRIFFESPTDLYVINIAAATESHVPLSAGPAILQFDYTSNTLYGIGALGGHTEIFSIDPSTGAMTPLAAASNTSMSGEISAFDPIAKRIFFESATDLYVVNIATGTESHVPLNETSMLLQFDPAVLQVDALSRTLMLLLAMVVACVGLLRLR